MSGSVENNRKGILLARLRSEEGYLIILVSMVGVIFAYLLGSVLLQLHAGQFKKAVNNLNEYRAYEAARKGVDTVQLGLKELDNLQDLTGYALSSVTPSGVTTPPIFTVQGDYTSLFPSGVSLQVYFSTGKDGTYTVSGVTAVSSGTTKTEITVKETCSNGQADGLICRMRGVFWAIDQVTGITTPPKYDEYTDAEGRIQFVSGCSMPLPGNEGGAFTILVLVSRNGVIHEEADGRPGNDGWYLFDSRSGITGWLSADRWAISGTTPLSHFRYVSGTSVHYYDFDMKAPLDGTNYTSNADLKVQRSGGRSYLSIGQNGSWRGRAGANEMWDLGKAFSSGGTPFQAKDNDGDGDVDPEDVVEAFVAVRAIGATAAAGPTYEADKRSLSLVAEVEGSHLPSPLRQILEAGFYLEDDGKGQGKGRRFFFGQAHNLED